MKQLWRMFEAGEYKGRYGYIDTQKKYEILRTIIYYGISLALFFAGYISTGTKNNLLTIVAVLGCLPASKSLISVIMFLKFHSMDSNEHQKICNKTGDLHVLYDLVFTTYDKNYVVDSLTISGKNICGYSSNEKTDVKKCEEHLLTMLTQDGFKDCTVKIYTVLDKYLVRLEQLNEINDVDSNKDSKDMAIIELVKSITL